MRNQDDANWACRGWVALRQAESELRDLGAENEDDEYAVVEPLFERCGGCHSPGLRHGRGVDIQPLQSNQGDANWACRGDVALRQAEFDLRGMGEEPRKPKLSLPSHSVSSVVGATDANWVCRGRVALRQAECE